MSVFLDISAALDTQLNAMSGLPPVAWENDDYKPEVNTLYLRATHLPGTSETATIGTSGTDYNIGVYQVDVFAPLAKGKNEAFVMADLVADQFKRDTVLTYNSRNVTIQSVSLRNGRMSDGWYQLPVDIVYYSFTAERS